MQRNLAVTPNSTVHQCYRQLIRAGLTPDESVALIALADGIPRHAEGESPATTTWTCQEISRIEFMRYLVRQGRLEGPTIGGRSTDRSRRD
jgi:hypothetical protein